MWFDPGGRVRRGGTASHRVLHVVARQALARISEREGRIKKSYVYSGALVGFVAIASLGTARAPRPGSRFVRATAGMRTPRDTRAPAIASLGTARAPRPAHQMRAGSSTGQETRARRGGEVGSGGRRRRDRGPDRGAPQRRAVLPAVARGRAGGGGGAPPRRAGLRYTILDRGALTILECPTVRIGMYVAPHLPTAAAVTQAPRLHSVHRLGRFAAAVCNGVLRTDDGVCAHRTGVFPHRCRTVAAQSGCCASRWCRAGSATALDGAAQGEHRGRTESRESRTEAG